jgi:hypothetical protein
LTCGLVDISALAQSSSAAPLAPEQDHYGVKIGINSEELEVLPNSVSEKKS